MSSAGDPFRSDDEKLGAILGDVGDRAADYLQDLGQRPVQAEGVEAALESLHGSLPVEGLGARRTVEWLLEVGTAASIASVGPRFFHFVIGGVTPAALAADELLMDPPLNVVCFRYRPRGHTDEGLDDLNRRVGDAVLTDGWVYVGTTVYDGRRALRAVVINWRTTREDVDLLLDVIGDLGASLSER